MGLRSRGRSATAAALATAVLLLPALAAPGAGAAEPGLQASGEFFTASGAETLSRRQAERVWTPERVAQAPPLELAAADGTPRTVPRDPELFAAAAEPFSSRQVDPTRYPNRVHGKLVGTFPGLGDFSCSATIVSSDSGSLLTTAGHCAYDLKHKIVATNLAFVPGYSAGSLPFGVWPVSNLILNRQWVKGGSLDYDFSMMRTILGPYGPVQLLGSRGIGFNQPRKQRLQAYGYPARGNPAYDGTKLIRCDSGYVPDPVRYGGPRGRGMHCDQQQGSSGGGWVAQHSFVVSNTSHGYPRLSNSLFFGPYYGAVAKSMYRANLPGWPSIGPVRCGGEVATIVGSNRRERIRGTGGSDVIATLGGSDRVSGKGGRDRICAGVGNDVVSGGGGRDRVDGGRGKDRCGRRRGGDELHSCEGGGNG